ncbi:MAG: hypothetical protein HC876_17035 [Chloroflexaceae bacterium]|nr:hypothetical protein [Chloroflexaceae bacterium]
MRRIVSQLALLALVLAVVLSVLPISTPAQGAPGQSVFGVNSHVGSRYGDMGTVGTPIGLLAEAETGWAREEFQWSLVTNGARNDVYDWSMLDAVINDLHSRGINIIGLLNDAPNAGPPRTDAEIAGFTNFAEAAVRRYGDKVRYWEVWNEPENFLYWGGLPNAQEYTRLLISVSQRIKSVDGSLQVLNAGIVPTHIDYIRQIHAAGGWPHFDILALHPYVDPFTPETGQIGDGGDLSKIQMLNEQLGAKPIWATEYGWATGPSDRTATQPVDAATQAAYLVRGATLLQAAGVERIIWYKFKDENAGRNEYGMFAHGAGRTDFGSPKPTFIAFKTLNQQLAGAGNAEVLPIGQETIVLDFELDYGWRSGDPGRGTLSNSTARARSGTQAGALQYNFFSAGNDFVGLDLPQPIAIPGSPAQLGVWVYGNGSGHELLAALRDVNGEILKFRLGVIGSGERWRFVSTPINGEVETWRCEGGCQNRRLDYPVTLVALLLEDNPDPETGSGTFYIDDLTAMSSTQGVRFRSGGEVVDILWAVQDGQPINLPTTSEAGTLTEWNGTARTVAASNGAFQLQVGRDPVYIRHAGGSLTVAPPAAPPPAETIPTTTETGSTVGPDAPPGDNCRTFPETGYMVCDRMLEYWQQNDGLRVFGYPITPQRQEIIEGRAFQVQWFERNRLELHPANARPYDVLLGRLGDERRASASITNASASISGDGCVRFAGSEHEVCGVFLQAWRANGLDLNGNGIAGDSDNESLALFGLPLTPPRIERLSDGNEYIVQWFERSRFEYHPQNSPPFDVLYGLLGNEIQGRQ